MTRNYTTRFIVAAAAVVAVVWLAVWNNNQRRSAQVTRLAAIQVWPLGHGEVFSTEPYVWLDSHEIFHFTGDSMRGYPAVTYNTAAQTEQAEPNLTRVEYGHVVSASPDGQWVLWDTQKFNNSIAGMAATRRSDGKTVRWPNLQTDRNDGFWLPDSRHWVCVTVVPTGRTMSGRPILGNRIVIYDVNHAGSQSFVISGNSSMTNILGVTPQGKVIFNDTLDEWGGPPGQPQPPLSLREVSLDGLQPTARTFSVQAPKTPPGESARVSLSPQGDRLLWTCFSAMPNSLSGWFSRLTHQSFVGGRESLDIWTCPLNGGVPAHVGTWSGSQMGYTAGWNPDGKHVSMTMNGELYSISVP